MSETVPICDALTQAAEYLCKLGSNLKIRSENVIEKRISKQRLRKPNGIQKAVDKMLLICDLSKKSLVNVENTIHKILNSSSAKPQADDASPGYHVFDYKGCKLRITKKITLSQFLSAKVLVKRMAPEMYDKYPLYINCKLYQKRKLQDSPKKLASINYTEKERSKFPSFTEADRSEIAGSDKRKAKKIKFMEDSEDEQVNDSTENNTTSEIHSVKSTLDNTATASLSNDDSKNSSTANIISAISDDVLTEHSNTPEPYGNQSCKEKKVHDSKKQVEIVPLNETKSDNLEHEIIESAQYSMKHNSKSGDFTSLKKVVKKSGHENSQNLERSHSVDADTKLITHDSKAKEDIEQVTDIQHEESDTDILNKSDSEKHVETDMSKDEVPKPNTSRNLETVDNPEEPDSDKLVGNNPDFTEQRAAVASNGEKQTDNCKESEKSAFILRCVDINKLKTQAEETSEIEAQKSQEKEDFMSKSDNVKEKSQSHHKNKATADDGKTRVPNEEETKNSDNTTPKDSGFKEPETKKRKFMLAVRSKYWDAKRKKYSFFAPRPCTVKVTKMHNCFVHIYFNDKSVKMIKYKGTSVLSMEEVMRVDNPDIKFKKIPEPVYKKKCACALAHDSPHKKNKIKRKISEGSADKKSKRKNIMESMHAKKMLLTYSSSSETEDEQLREALKEIKDSLMKGMSSSDEDKPNILKNVIEKHRRRLLVSSSSDDEIGCSNLKAGVGDKQGSDSEDTEKDIDGLTKISTLHKLNRRRRDSTSASKTEESCKRRSSRRMSKAPVIDSTTMLAAESNSSGEDSAPEAGDMDELPEVSMEDINGGGALDQLARTDLLEESAGSNSDDDKTAEDGTAKEEEPTSSEEKSIKSKRRKNAAAILSDSEGGSKKKAAGGKSSDFEESDDESSETNKRSRKNKAVDSDASTSATDEPSKKKRRRIKQVDDSDVESGSESETEGKKHGRKNIRKVMGKNQLEEATKKAARQEKERIARIAERQKLYNNLAFDESGKPDEVVLDKVILDFDPDTKEPLIEVDRGLVKKLKPHQANGIKFMWDACFESVKRMKKDKGSGCILAHCMGLGKTLQVVSLTHTLLTHGDLTGVRRVLVVCPLSTVLNWVNEFKMWLKHAECDEEIVVYELSKNKQNLERAMQLQYWYEEGGVCVLGYEMFRNLSADNSKKYRKKVLKTFQLALVDPGPDLVVCDEGHLLKNEKTSLSQSMNRVKTLRRIVLTGTPLQNNLKEYYCMVQFVKPNLLGKYNEYLNRFVNPITNGQYTDSTEHDIRIMKRRSHVLHKMLDGAVQRRDYGVLAPFLPPKHEYVLFITLTDVQGKLYQHYLDNYSRRPLPGKSSGFLFPDFQSLQRIWTHPLVLKYNSERYEIMQQKKRDKEEEEDSEGSLVDFIDDESTAEETSSEDSMDDLSDASDDSRKKGKKKKASKNKKSKETKSSSRRNTRANPVEQTEADLEIVEVKNENPTEWWIKLVTEEELDDMRNSSKLVLLFDILRQCEAIGDKLLVFSQSLYSLDLIEHFLGKVDEATQEGRVDEKLGNHVGSWSPGVDYFRLDGSTSCENRSIWCKNFNREDNPRARLFLISTRAGGLGINLVAANRVVIFDVSWNPSHDVQSIFRVYRFGQKKPCYIYRFLAMGTMEEKIYERQVTKQAISKRVIDEQQIDRHYAENDLAELYNFEPRPPEPRPLPPLPKDRLFAEMLREHEKQIYKYHEHDSLLENKEEETLTEEERKAAWEDFENEKNRPPPAPFANMWPMHNAGLLAQQQQQLAYTALAAVLRKDMPNMTDTQIRELMPLVYNANPALMQKMSEIYKYMPPNMMSQAAGMMNSGLMNAAAAGGGMGSSGMQFEPQWQRQQQQQHQMRLQQLLQHQNQMGAKYYQGGLGSRDPVAMALQQQFAREIGGSGGGGAGTGAGRPRGRPPLQPRAPLALPPQAAPTGDVVNLDSD